MVTRAPASRVNRCASGLRISAPVSGTSSPLTSLGPVTSTRSTRGSSEGTWIASFLRFSSTSVRLSVTPAILVSVALTPSILTQATAAPGTIDSSVRRSELPTVSA